MALHEKFKNDIRVHNTHKSQCTQFSANSVKEVLCECIKDSCEESSCKQIVITKFQFAHPYKGTTINCDRPVFGGSEFLYFWKQASDKAYKSGRKYSVESNIVLQKVSGKATG